jgi:coenzyme F420-0:L-glutamate ligase / coenzyme F420-1:gamma-L-glutamate ligase
MKRLEIIAVEGLAEVEPGDSVGKRIVESLDRNAFALAPGDIVVVAQKIISKAEGRMRDLRDVIPSPEALRLSKQLEDKDPRLVELILQESQRIIRTGRQTIIVETHHGLVCANAGIDLSNTGIDRALLLPKDPDASARRIRDEVRQHTGVSPGVIVTDTFGRPWRLGTTDVAIGVAGFNPLVDYRGQKDRFGYELKASITAVADQIAGAAELVMGKTRDVPAVIVRGYDAQPGEGSGRDLLRPIEEDLFRDR